MKLAIVGATGCVGRTFLQLIQERNFPVTSLKLFASEKNLGKSVRFRNRNLELELLKELSFQGLDLVFFSAGEEISRIWVPQVVRQGALVIDNSSAFRMNEDIPLIVPEINGLSLKKTYKDKGAIIANPNCSTIQLVCVLYPLQKKFGLESVSVASYQSISGKGGQAIDQFKEDSLSFLQGNLQDRSLLQSSHVFNCIPQIGSLNDQGFSTEEVKMMEETKKILSLPNLKITATAVRTPTLNGHCEAVWVSLKKFAHRQDVQMALKEQKGVQVIEEEGVPNQHFVNGWDDVYVGRIRSLPNEKTWMMWVAADNLRKGAALNALQIAEQFLITRK